MDYQKLVTLSSFVLVLSVIAINAGGGGNKGGKEGSMQMMALLAYCMDCQAAQPALNKYRVCVKAISSLKDQVNAIGTAKGTTCMEKLKGEGSKMTDDQKVLLKACLQQLKTDGGKGLMDCRDQIKEKLKAAGKNG